MTSPQTDSTVTTYYYQAKTRISCTNFHKNTHLESAFTKKLAKFLAIVAIDYTVLPPVLAVLDWVVGTNDGLDKSRDNDQTSLKTLLFWMAGVPTST